MRTHVASILLFHVLFLIPVALRKLMLRSPCLGKVPALGSLAASQSKGKDSVENIGAIGSLIFERRPDAEEARPLGFCDWQRLMNSASCTVAVLPGCVDGRRFRGSRSRCLDSHTLSCWAHAQRLRSGCRAGFLNAVIRDAVSIASIHVQVND